MTKFLQRVAILIYINSYFYIINYTYFIYCKQHSKKYKIYTTKILLLINCYVSNIIF